MDPKRRIFVEILLAIVLVNVMQFAGIDEDTSDRYAAIKRYSTPNVIEVGYNDSPHFRQAYGLYLALADIAPGSAIILPESGGFASSETLTRVLGYGQADTVKYVKYDRNADRFLPVDLSPGVLHKSANSGVPYMIAASDVGGRRGDSWSIVTDKRNNEDHKAQREFMLLEWRKEGKGNILVIETSLLPSDIRERLSI
jgi:hypothetical protein